MSIATEIVTMKTIEGISFEQFTAIVNALEEHYHSKQPGFIDTELLYNEKTDEWVMIQHWEDLNAMKTASRRMFNNPVTAPFVASLNPKTVKMLMLLQLQKWPT